LGFRLVRKSDKNIIIGFCSKCLAGENILIRYWIYGIQIQMMLFVSDPKERGIDIGRRRRII
jgi:hypothetical protein